MDKRTYQRRAIYTVLKRWLDESSLVKALDIFEQSYQDRPTQAVHEYLSQIVDLYQDKVDSKTLRQSLMQVLLRKTDHLAPDPLPMLIEYRNKNNYSEAYFGTDRFGLNSPDPSDEQLALHQLVSEIMRKVKPEQRRQLHSRIANQLRQRFVNGNFDKLAQYLLSDNPQFLTGFNDQALQDFFTALYVAACEVLGPVAADKWFAGTLNQVTREQDDHQNDGLYRYL